MKLSFGKNIEPLNQQKKANKWHIAAIKWTYLKSKVENRLIELEQCEGINEKIECNEWRWFRNEKQLIP